MESDEAFSEIALEFKAAKFIRKNSGVLLRPDTLRSKLEKADTALMSNVDKQSQNTQSEPLLVEKKMTKIKNRAI